MHGTTVEKLKPWFDEMTEVLNKHHYPPEYIFNMDETGYALGATQSTRVLAVVERGEKGGKAWKSASGKQEWVTTIECVSASGKALAPLVIFRATGNFQLGWLPRGVEAVKDWSWSTSRTGWTNDFLAYKWLAEVFQPQTLPSSPNQRRLLIVDGHGSHVKAPFIAFCMKNAIDLMVLPSHSSHITQPLDVGIFAPLKAAMARATDRASRYEEGRVQKVDWAESLAYARENAMTEKNILVGWKHTGLYPFSPRRVLSQAQTAATPPPNTPTRLSRTPLGSLSSDNMDSLRVYEDRMNTPVKRRFETMASSMEGLHARNTMLEKENQDLKDLQASKKKPRRGATVAALGTHVFSSQECYRQIEELEALTAARKTKGKQRAQRVVPELSPDGEEENPFLDYPSS